MTAAFWAYPLSTPAGDLLASAQHLDDELHTVHGLKPGAPLTVTATQRTAGSIVQTINTSGGTTTVARQ